MNENRDFRWALEQARREAPTVSWRLGEFYFGLCVGLAGEVGDYRNAVWLLRPEEPEREWSRLNVNDKGERKRALWLSRRIAAFLKAI